MKLFTALILALARTSLAFGDDSTAWTITDMTPVTVLVGLYATEPNEVYCAISDNALGPGLLHSTDYGSTDEYVGPTGGLMNMDVAFNVNSMDGCMVGMGGMYVTHDRETFQRVTQMTGISQNVITYGEKLMGAVGGFFDKEAKKSANGIAFSTDAGTTWQLTDIGLDSSYIARYGSFPSESVWYVTSGMWPTDDASVREQQKSLRQFIIDTGLDLNNEELKGKLPEELKIPLSAHITRTLNIKSEKQAHEFTFSASNNVRTSEKADSTGWIGGISKTTDGGKSWTQVFDTHLAYFNEIHCCDDDNCMAVAENDVGAYGYATSDGGANWSLVLTADPGSSLMGAYMLSPQEAWLSGGGMVQGKGLSGFFYHTTDGGATWEMETLPQGYSMDLTFSADGTVGYSTAMNQAYSTTAIYQP